MLGVIAFLLWKLNQSKKEKVAGLAAQQPSYYSGQPPLQPGVHEVKELPTDARYMELDGLTRPREPTELPDQAVSSRW
jgi:hypothetical protein